MPQLKVRVGCVVLAVIMSAVTYYFVEPRLRWGRYGGYKAAGLLSVMVVVGVAGYSVMRHDGYVNRVKMNIDEKEIAKRVDYVWKAGQQRYFNLFPELLKIRGSTNGLFEREEGKNNIALFGDSHANALLPGLMINEGPSDGIAAFMMNCAIPLMGVQAGYGKEIQQKNRFPTHRMNYVPISKGFQYVLSHNEIKKVILTNFPGCFQFWGIRSLDNPLISSKEQILVDGISRTFKSLSEAGKEVVYVLDGPTFSKDGLDTLKVKACASKIASLHAPALPLRSAIYLSKDKVSIDEVCSIQKRDNGTAEGHALLKKLVEREAAKYKNVHVVDLMQMFCDEEKCTMIKNGKMLYRDSQHINRIGAAVVAPFVINSFGE